MWQSCSKPPFPFIRVEVKDMSGRIYLGFYALHKTWLETDGHYVIKNPDVWRKIEGDSILDREFRLKIRERNWARSLEVRNGT